MFPFLVMTLGVGLLVASAPNPAQAHDRECRRFTEKIYVDGNYVDSYGTTCQQADGSWREVEQDDDDDAKGGYSIRPQDSRYYRPDTHSYYGNNTHLIINDYVVAYPYYGHHNHHWSPAKRDFHQHHHGTGWEKHWEMHERTLEGR